MLENMIEENCICLGVKLIIFKNIVVVWYVSIEPSAFGIWDSRLIHKSLFLPGYETLYSRRQ
jgi:hypothetical protein